MSTTTTPSNCKVYYALISGMLAVVSFIYPNGIVLAQDEQQVVQDAQQATDTSQAVDVQAPDAPQAANAQAPVFDLNASMTDGLELSRQNLKHSSLKQAAPVEQPLPEPSPTAVAAVMPPVPTGTAMLPAGIESGAFSAGELRSPQAAQSGVVPLKSSTSVSEYGVDWSTWMSQVADHWYFQLTRLETQSPYEFYTDGPAQIEFTCYPNGQVSNIVLRRSCGVPMYDRMQIVALLSAVPLPPFPQGTQRASYTLCQGWEAHARHPGESDYQPGSFGRNTPEERVQKWD